MPVMYDLLEEGRVIYFKITEPITMNEILAGFPEARALRDKLFAENPKRQVHSLMDFSEINGVPPGVLRGWQSPAMTHPNRGVSVAVVPSRLGRELMLTLFELTHTDGKLFYTLDEAWAYLRSILDRPMGEDDADILTEPPEK